MDVALGYINVAHSGLSVPTELAAIEARARACQTDLVDVLVVERDCYLPIVRLCQTLRRCGATVLIVPTQDHVWTSRRGITDLARVEIVAPPATWAQGRAWDCPAAAR